MVGIFLSLTIGELVNWRIGEPGFANSPTHQFTKYTAPRQRRSLLFQA
jgi:hypothetical protein